MSSIAKANISLSKKDLTKSRIPPVASRNVVFYHKATGGELSIDLLALSMPSEMPTNVQATAAEISGAQLLTNKKNLTLQSSANGLLQQGLHYIVTSSTTIQLIGLYEVAGAEVDEIFTGVINSAPISDLVVASAKSVTKTYELGIGVTTLNLGYEYQTGVNPNDDVGIIKVFVNGVLAIRGTDYAEVDAGSGYGTTIEFYAAPVSLPYQIAVDFGVMAITDNNAIGTIENLAGAIKKIAVDLADVAGTSESDYYSASPSEIERRTFGDMVLGMLNVEVPIVTDWVDFPDVSAGVLITGTTTNPTYGTIANNRAQWRRVGSNMEVRWDYRQTTAGTAGSGNYLFNLPSGYQMDTTKVLTNTAIGSTVGTGFDSMSLGEMHLVYSTVTVVTGRISAYSATQVKGWLWNSVAGAVWGTATYDFAVNANAAFSIRFSVPIQGWSESQTIREILGL